MDAQLARLAEIGVHLNEGVERADLFAFHTQEELVKDPFHGLAMTMSMELEREPGIPISDQLWMCDFECVEGEGDYKAVLVRLERMTASTLQLSNITDFVDPYEEGVAWVSFDHAGQTVKWDMHVEEDWLDSSVFSRFDQLLETSGSDVRLFMASDQEEYGQAAFLAALTTQQVGEFSKLTGIPMRPVQ